MLDYDSWNNKTKDQQESGGRGVGGGENSLTIKLNVREA